MIVNYEQAIIPEFDETFHVKPIERDEYFQFYHKYDSMDLGVVDKTVCLFFYYDFKQAKVKITHETQFHGPTLTTEEIAMGLDKTEKEAFGEHKLYRRVSDNDNLLLIQDLGRLHNIHFSTTTKESLHAMVNKVRLWFDQGRIEIDPRCTELIGALKNGIWDAKRKQFARSPNYGHFDALAALVYGIRAVDESTNPVPHDYGYTSDTHIIHPQKQESIGKIKQMYPGMKRGKRGRYS